jgi:hypothetical protein
MAFSAEGISGASAKSVCPFYSAMRAKSPPEDHDMMKRLPVFQVGKGLLVVASRRGLLAAGRRGGTRVQRRFN